MRVRIALLALLLCGCVLPGVTFDDVSAPYLEEYGEPDEVFFTTLSMGMCVHWIWTDVLVVSFGWAEGIYEEWTVIREVVL